jgi:hypothetical protein
MTTYRNAKGQFMENPAEVAARYEAFEAAMAEDARARKEKERTDAYTAALMALGAFIFGLCLGGGICWHYMHNDQAEGYRLGRIQGQKDQAAQKVAVGQ